MKRRRLSSILGLALVGSPLLACVSSTQTDLAPTPTARKAQTPIPAATPTSAPTALPTGAPPTATTVPPTPIPPTVSPTPLPATPTQATAAGKATASVPSIGRGRLVYVTQSGANTGTLWLALAGDGKPVELASGMWSPEWALQMPQGLLEMFASGDGRMLFARTRSDSGQTLYAFSADGSNRREVASAQLVKLLGELQSEYAGEVFGGGSGIPRPLVSGSLIDRSVSRDGKRLWYVTAGGTQSGLYSWDIATGRREQIPTSGAILAVTPDRSKALFAERTGPTPTGSARQVQKYILAVVDLLSGERQEVATVVELSSTLPVLSPDGTKVLFVSQVNPGDLGDVPRKKVTLVDTANRNSLDLGEADGASGVFSPDSQRLYLLKGDGLYQKPAPKWSLVVVDVAKGTRTSIRAGFAEGMSPEVVQLFAPGTTPGTLELGGISNHRSGTAAYLANPSSGAVEELARSQTIQATYLATSGRLALYLATGSLGGGAPPGQSGAVPGKLLLVDPRTPTSRIELPTDIMADLPGPRSGEAITAQVSDVVESSDGKRVAALLYDSKAPAASRSKVLLIDLARPNPVELTAAAWIANLHFSPDGAQLAYTQRDRMADGLGPPTIYVASLDGKQREVAVANAALAEWLP